MGKNFVHGSSQMVALLSKMLCEAQTKEFTKSSSISAPPWRAGRSAYSMISIWVLQAKNDYF